MMVFSALWRYKTTLLLCTALPAYAFLGLLLMQIKGNGVILHFPYNSGSPPPSDVNPVKVYPDLSTDELFPSPEALLSMSYNDLEDFYHNYITSTQVLCRKIVRMGKIKDGGWEVCDDPLYRPPRSNCLVYSFGIGFDFSFDDAIVEKYGCEVQSYDPSMKMGDHTRGPHIHFHAVGVAGHDGVIHQNVERWKVQTVLNHRAMLSQSPSQRRVDVVKMDVEGSELEALNQALDDGSLADVRQLNFETHLSFTKDVPREKYIQFIELMRKVHSKGFRIYTTHRNYVYSTFRSSHSNKELVKCHEVHTINTNVINNMTLPAEV